MTKFQKTILVASAAALAGVLIVVFNLYQKQLFEDRVRESYFNQVSKVSADSLQVAAPRRLKIPKLTIDADIEEMGNKPGSNEMEVPEDIKDAGWYKLGPKPGEAGSAIITGHYARIRKGLITHKGLFNDLGELKIGDDIYVEDKNGVLVKFEVKDKKSYAWDAKADEVFASGGSSELRLITCEGEWLSAKLTYSKRLVVFAEKVN